MTAARALRLEQDVPAKAQTRLHNAGKEKLWIGGVFLTALILRLLYLCEAPQTPIIGDAAKYYEAGRALANGAASEDIWPLMVSRGPIYPLFLSAIFSFFSVDPWPVRFVQAVVSALSCVLVYSVGRQLASRGVALIAGFTMAVFPNLIFYSGRILTETLSIFLFWLGIAALMRSLHCRAPRAKSHSTSGRSPSNQPKGATQHAQPDNNRPDAVTFNRPWRGRMSWRSNLHGMCALYDVFSQFAGRSLATWPQWWGLRVDPAAIGGRNVLSLSLAWRDSASGFCKESPG